MRIALIVRSLDKVAGGLEHSVIKLANDLHLKGYNVCIYSLDGEFAESHFSLEKGIDWIKCNIGDVKVKSSTYSRFQRLIKIRNFLKMNGISTAITFQGGITTLVSYAAVFLKLTIVAAERESLSKYKYMKFSRLKKYAHFFNLIRADKIQVFFESYKNSYPPFLRNKCVIIPNYIYPKNYLSLSNLKSEKVKVLYVGRFEYPKNLEILVESAIRLKNSVDLTLIGEGSLELKLREIAEGHLNVKFIGKVDNLSEYYRNHDFLCLISLWEGFPNVAIESMEFGLPVLGFSWTDGLANLIENGVNGYLSEEPLSAESVTNLLKNSRGIPFDRMRVNETIKQYYVDNILPLWEAILK